MNITDIHKTIVKNSGDSIRKLSVLNPLTIHKKGTRTKAFFCLALVCFFWGTTWVASKRGVLYMPALQMAGIRQTIAGLLYTCFFLFRGAALPKGKEWRSVLILSFLNFLMSNGLSTWGIAYISAGLGSIMGAIFPLWLVVIGLFSVKQKIQSKARLGLLLGFAGICIIFYEHLGDFLLRDFRFGILLSLIATWTWAFATIYTKSESSRFNPYFSLGLQMLISGVSLLFITKITDGTRFDNYIPFSEIPWQSWLSIGYLVIFGSVISFIAYLYALQNLPAEQVSIYAYINPVVAVLIGAIYFHEKLSLYICIGGLIALWGVFMVNKSFRQMQQPAQAETEGV